MNLRQTLLIFFLFSFALIITAQDEKISSNDWQLITASDGSKPMARHEAAFIRVGDYFYLFGGRGVKPMNIYDVKNNTWTEGATPPIEIHHFQPVVFDDKIYVIGAMTGNYPSETPVPEVYIYNPKEDDWSKGGNIPKKRRRGATGNVVYKDHIYVACGIKNGHIGDHKKWLDRYNPITNSWEKLADAPRERDHFQAVVVGDKIYAAAGRVSKAPDATFTETIAEVDVYDVTADSWETLSQVIPTPRAGNTAIAVADEVYIIGGESTVQETAHGHVEVLNCKTATWRTLPEMTTGRHGTGVLLYQEQLYIAAGCANRGGEPELDTMEYYKIN